MKINYYPETDSLYIDLSHKASVDSREVSEGVVLDYDEAGNLVGIDIDHATPSWICERSSSEACRWNRLRFWFRNSIDTIQLCRPLKAGSLL